MRLAVIGLVLIAEAALSVPYVHSKIWPDSRTQAAPAAPSVHIHSAAPASSAPPVGANRGPASVPPRAAAPPANVQSSVPPSPTRTVAVNPGQASVAPSAAAASPGHMHSPLPSSPATTGGAGRVQSPPPANSAPAAPSAQVTPPASATPAVVAADPCTALHDSFKVRGPDGLMYPTWHPPTVQNCHFGHEHGDDPNGSPALNGRPLMFGYAAVKIQMAEPHAGFKVFRQDNVNDSHAPNHTGASVVMALHQGSSGLKRFTEVHHSAAFHYVNPRDGREVHVNMIAPFGELLVGCGATEVYLRVQQAPIPGTRGITAAECLAHPGTILYEDWLTALYVGYDRATGLWKAYLDPHFAVFEPNTYCVVTNGACSLGYSDALMGTGADPLSVRAKFKGTKHHAYLNQVGLRNDTGISSIWTDAHGILSTRDTPGAIEQYVAAITLEPFGDSIAFGVDRNSDDGTVHAPN